MKLLIGLKGWFSVAKLKIKNLLRSKWVVFGIGPLVTLVAIGVVIWIGHLLTTHPAICLSCHARQSRIPMWSASLVHPPRVTCVDCHAKPGTLFPRHFFADQKVNDNCLVCHSTVAQQEVAETHHMRIAHKIHIEESNLLCIDCHRNIAHEKMEAGTNRPQRLTCKECHPETIEGGPESCSKCHTKIPVASS